MAHSHIQRLLRFRLAPLRALVGAAMVLAVLCSGGCTANRLQRGTISQSSTLTDLQYQQVLDNLAMFACNPDSMAWHVKVNGGVVQVADQGMGIIGANAGGPQQFAPSLGLQRNVLHQWNVDPVIDSNDLELLHIAYRKAVNPEDIEGTIRRDAFEQICELSTGYHIALTREVAMKMVDALHVNATPQRQQKLDDARVALDKLYDRMDEIACRGAVYNPEKLCHNGCQIPSELEFVQEEIIKLCSSICESPYVPIHSLLRQRRNPGLVDQAEDRISALLSLVDEPDDGEPPNLFSIPWINVGCNKKQIPVCACYVGRHTQCGQTCYVWVMPEQAKALRDFTLIILSLAPPDAQDAAPQTNGLGAANSPGF